MADLIDMLLEAAGRTNDSEGSRCSSPPKNKRRYSYSDGSDSKGDDSDDGRGYLSRKPSQLPLKKRLDPVDRDDGHNSNEEGDGFRDRDSDDDSVGSDLYKDEDDRKKLANMTELKREMILAERASLKSDREMHEKLAEKRKLTPPQSASRGMRSSTRFADRTAAKDDALNEIRAKRMRKQDPEAHQKLKDAGSGGRSYSPIKRRSFSAAILGSLTRSGSGSDEENSSDDGGLGDSDDEKESKVPTYEDIRQITIRRSKLAKWLMEPFFDDLIVGCFVRVGIGKTRTGPIYRLCSVRNIDASDPDRLYKLDNKTTYKWLNCVWANESSAARWQMAMVSDSPPTRDEYEQWVRELERNSGRIPTKQEVLEKKEAIQKTNSFVYSAETVKLMLQDKKSATWRPLNVAAEKDRLRKEIAIAKEKNDEQEVERLKLKVKELEATRVMDEKAEKLAEMNKKNRIENFKNASGSGAINADAKAGEAGYDPFSRRWTSSRNYYHKESHGAEAAAATAGDGSVAAVADGVSAEAGTDAKTGSVAVEKEDTIVPADQGTELVKQPEFKIEISLDDSHKYRVHAGFMARKQRLEATIGRRVPENDGRRHASTLTVSDYKRRMGQL